MMNSASTVGFTYKIEHLRDGALLSEEVCKNLIPTVGLNYILDTAVKASSAYPAWYIGLFEGNYTPVAGVTMSTLPTDATETTAYSQTTRPAFTAGVPTAGSVDNSASRAEFTFTANKTVYGGFMSSGNTKSGTSGMALSVVRFTSPKVVETGDILRVTSGLTLSNV